MSNYYLIEYKIDVKIPSKSQTKGVPRSEMPQVNSKDVEHFQKFLRMKGVKTAKKTVDASNYKAIQGEFNKEKVEGMAQKMLDDNWQGKPLIVSKDKYVIDGNHRWLAHVAVGRPMDVFEVQMSADELMKVMKEYSRAGSKEIHEHLAEAFEYVCESDTSCEVISVAQMKSFEKLVDGLFAHYKTDFTFTKHFRERMSDNRNKPCINLKELADLIKKLYMKVKANGKTLSQYKDTEAVIKDMMSKLNLPIAVEYNREKDELEVIGKTIMRKNDFKTPNPVLKV